MHIKLNGATDCRDGYGEITHNLARALMEKHVVSITPNMVWHSLDYMKPDIKSLINRSTKQVDFELFIFYPNNGLSSRYKCGILTMWEGSSVPSPWVEGLNRFTDVFAPSEFVRDVFIESDVKANVHLLPLGVNTNFYKTVERSMPTDRPFRFLTVGKMEPRKNLDTLITAFRHQFTLNEDVELWIKTRERFCSASVKMAAQEDKRINIIEKTITEDELRELYRVCDCFVYPSRGEGFAFPPRNAIATGMPTIVTDWSALSEIEGAVKVPIRGLSPMHACGFSFGEESSILMADVNPETLGIIMRDVFDKYQKYVKWTLANRRITLWSESADYLVSTIKSII